MTNLDSILKSRDIANKGPSSQVKAMVFSVVIYGCESWTVKKAEHQRIDAFFFNFLRFYLFIIYLFFNFYFYFILLYNTVLQC